MRCRLQYNFLIRYTLTQLSNKDLLLFIPIYLLFHSFPIIFIHGLITCNIRLLKLSLSDHQQFHKLFVKNPSIFTTIRVFYTRMKKQWIFLEFVLFLVFGENLLTRSNFLDWNFCYNKINLLLFMKFEGDFNSYESFFWVFS